jgi:hypothetical protein
MTSALAIGESAIVAVNTDIAPHNARLKPVASDDVVGTAFISPIDVRDANAGKQAKFR